MSTKKTKTPKEKETVKSSSAATPAPKKRSVNQTPAVHPAALSARLAKEEALRHRKDKKDAPAEVVEPTDPDQEDVRVETVEATRAGYYGHSYRREGDVFDMTLRGDGFLPSWVKIYDEEEHKAAEHAALKSAKKGKKPAVDGRPNAEGVQESSPAALGDQVI